MPAPIVLLPTNQQRRRGHRVLATLTALFLPLSMAVVAAQPISSAKTPITDHTGLQQAHPSPDPIAQLSRYYFAAARQNDVEVLRAFLQAGFPVNHLNNQSYSALMIAAYAGASEAVTVLLQHQADPCLRDKRGNTALLAAIIKAEFQIARTLYQQSCADRPNKAGLDLAAFANMFGQSKLLTQLQAEAQTHRH
ncbi:MAG: ankyrin repeat domain-containing protein [Ferrimonas sp.]